MSISPFYSIHQYGEGIFKVVAFKGIRDPDFVVLRDRSDDTHYDNKLDSNFSRARSLVLQYALCNPWDYFFTGTLDKEKWNRNDLDSFMSDFSQKIRDWRKDYGSLIQVLLVPEHHDDGAWHVHGLIRGVPSWHLFRFYWIPLRELGLTAPFPQKLCQNDEWRYWDDFLDRYGFCSLAPIRDPVATAYYISKYVSKDLSRRSGDLGKHLYFHSRPLKKAEKMSDVYLHNPQLDGFCTQEYDFCKVGMVKNAPWYFPYFWDGADYPVENMKPEPLQIESEFHPSDIDPFYEQTKIPGYR